MSTLSTLLTDLTTYISQADTSNLDTTQRVRYLEISREGVANSHDWPFLYAETDLTVALKDTNAEFHVASLPSDIKARKIRSIHYPPSNVEYVGVDEHEFFRAGESTQIYTIGIGSSGEEIRLKGVEGADADADSLLDGQATSSSSTTAVTSFLAALDVPRQILFTPGGTTGDIAAGNITVVGTDTNGVSQTVTVAITEDMTSTVATTAHFKTVTSITFPQMDGDGATFDVGTNGNVGLRIQYLKTLTAWSSSDTSVDSDFPNEMDEAILLGAAYRIFMKFNRDKDQIANYKAEYLDHLTRSWQIYGKDMKSQRRQIKNLRAINFKPISKTRYGDH